MFSHSAEISNAPLTLACSMGSGFPEDPDRRNKLDVAKDCLLHITKQLGPRDRLSVITFNTDTKVVLSTDYCTPRHINKRVPPHVCSRCPFAPLPPSRFV